MGFLLNLLTGIWFFFGFPEQYFYNPSFQLLLTFVAIAGINCSTVGPLDEAVLVSQCVVGPGDSGGPVYSYASSSGPSVNGRGTITAGYGTAATCPGASAPVAGWDTVLYAPLLRPAGDPQIGSLQFWGITLLP